jgi:hypothetical protein
MTNHADDLPSRSRSRLLHDFRLWVGILRSGAQGVIEHDFTALIIEILSIFANQRGPW